MTVSRKLRTLNPVEDESEPIEYSSPACYLHEFEGGQKAVAVPRVRIKRIYDAPDPADGFRVLVDRLWPRGINKEQALLDAWARELAPSAALRKWFQHDPGRWLEFRARYREELRDQAMQLDALRQCARQQPVTLLYAARDKQINHAAVLRDVIEED
jgi:uncharacterized protein YeaO (DUF488 family)